MSWRVSPLLALERWPLARLRADKRAAAALEFAFVAPMLFALLFAIIETCLIYFTSSALQTATEKTARMVLTGQAQANGLTASQFQQTACAALPSYMNCSNLFVDVQTASSFSSVNTTSPQITFDSTGKVSNSFNYTPGGSGDIVIIRLMYIWPVPSGPLGLNFSNLGNGQRLLIATSVAKTEPY